MNGGDVLILHTFFLEEATTLGLIIISLPTRKPPILIVFCFFCVFLCFFVFLGMIGPSVVGHPHYPWGPLSGSYKKTRVY